MTLRTAVIAVAVVLAVGLSLLTPSILPAQVAKKCDPPTWYVRVYFDVPTEPGNITSELFPFCSEADAWMFRHEVDAHGLSQYGNNSLVWNSVSHSAIRGFAVDPNVWGDRSAQ